MIEDGKQETIIERKKFIKDMATTFANEIPGITHGLTMYPGISCGEIRSKSEFTEDVENLKTKLEYYKNKLLDNEELASKQNDIRTQVNIENHNTVIISMDFNQAIETIDSSKINDDLKEEIRNLISELESCKKKGRWPHLRDKVCDASKFIIDKSADLFVELLPYLCQLVQI